MKHLRFLTLGLLLFALVKPYGNAQELTIPEAQRAMWRYLRDYSPTSFQIIQDAQSRPSRFQVGATRVTVPNESPPLAWVSEFSEEGVRTSLNTIVHETIHGMTSAWPYVLLEKQDNVDYGFKDNYSAYFLSKDEIYLVKHTKVFSSNELTRYIPKRLRTFRFDPYIHPKDNDLGSQIQGIYGLLDEWNAYYHGTRTAYDLFGYYQRASREDPQLYLEHISDLAGTYFAHYEFKYYVLSYMLHARRKYPEIYGDLLSNHELRKAYKAINKSFEDLISSFQTRLDNLGDNISSEAGTVRIAEKNGFFFIGRKGVGLFKEETDNLKAELLKPEFLEMDKILTPLN